MGATPQTPDDVIAWMKRIDADLSLLHERVNNPLANTGLSVPSAGVVEVDGTLNVNGPMAVTGTLSLPAGIINNDALASPVSGDAFSPSAAAFSVNTVALTSTETAGADVTIPAGFSRAVGVIGGWVVAKNTRAVSDYLYAQCSLGAGPTWAALTQANPVPIAPGAYNQASCGVGFKLSGLTSGSVLRLSVYAMSSGAAFTADPSNTANAYAVVTWLR